MCLSVCTVTKQLIGTGCRLEWSEEVEIVKGEGAVFGVNVDHPIVTNGILRVRGGDAALPKLFWDFLF